MCPSLKPQWRFNVTSEALIATTNHLRNVKLALIGYMIRTQNSCVRAAPQVVYYIRCIFICGVSNKQMGRPKLIEDDQLLAFARKVFIESGALGSTRDIAKQAGISEAALFQRYPTKAALFLAAMIPPEMNASAIIDAGLSQTDPRKALILMCKQMLIYFRSMMPVALQLLAHPKINIKDVVKHLKKAQPIELADVLEDYLRSMHRQGKVKVKDPKAVAALLIAAVHSIALFELMGVHGGEFPDQGIDMIVTALWLGLAPTKPAAPKTRRSTKK